MKLVFFDIDGTLLAPSQAGRRAMSMAAAELAGRPVDLAVVGSFAGRTDRGIMIDILAAIDREANQANFTALTGAYLRHLPEALRQSPGSVLPGMAEVLHMIAASPSAHAAGLLTGNLSDGAKLKLDCHRLSDFFGFGGFGDTHAARNDVAASALASACQRLGRTEFDEVFVIGDTPDDVACAKSIGATAVGVCTGRFSREALSGADWVFDDFSDLGEVRGMLGLR